MIIKVNCKYNDDAAWCTNKNIKRSIFGIGARVCIESNGGKCNLKERKTPRPKILNDDLLEVDDLIEFDDNGIIRRGLIQVVGVHGYWINNTSGAVGSGSIRCPFDKAVLIKKHAKK